MATEGTEGAIEGTEVAIEVTEVHIEGEGDIKEIEKTEKKE